MRPAVAAVDRGRPPAVAPGRPTGRVAGGLHYGALGLPLAFVALPLYVLLPPHYAGQFGVPLATLGALLLAVRALDALVDPLLGRWADRLLDRGAASALRALGLAALALVAGFVAIFFPPRGWLAGGGSDGAGLLGWCALALVATCLAYSLATVLHQAWGARLGGGDAAQSRWVAWREGAALAGVMLASVLPAVAGLPATAALLALALGAAWLLLHGAPPPPRNTRPGPAAGGTLSQLWRPWRAAAFRRLLAVYMLGGIASAVPATLLLFFVRDRLQAPGWEGALLATYFAAAALSLPLWVRLVPRWGLARCWAAGMALAVACFSGAGALGVGDAPLFLLICVASGLALGADLAFPGALLARVQSPGGQGAGDAGTAFGWWASATKLNLALAAGVALPLLQWAGYAPGVRDADALQVLGWAYGLLPCVLKLLALAALWRWRHSWESRGD